jgi:hypothetical protein
MKKTILQNWHVHNSSTRDQSGANNQSFITSAEKITVDAFKGNSMGCTRIDEKAGTLMVGQ